MTTLTKNKISSAGTGGVKIERSGVTFTALCPDASCVQIAGDFNDWQPERTPLSKVGKAGLWKVKLPLGPGTYRYRLVVDGCWQQDPYNDQCEPNPYGEMNSILHIS
jgi:1,4-alpha-glucan branching enzyme